MRRIVRCIALLSSGLLCANVIAQAPAPQTAPKLRSPFQLIRGYKVEIRYGPEPNEEAGRIWKPGGLAIDWNFDAYGGSIIDEIEQKEVLWRLELPSSGNPSVMVRTRENRVAISIATHLNFSATIHSDQELAEMLLMCLTYNFREGFAAAPDAIIIDPPFKK